MTDTIMNETNEVIANDDRNIFIVRCGEVALKGMNKPYFERMLVERIRRMLKKYENTEVKRHEGLIFVRTDKSFAKDEIIGQISKVFGVASISPAVEVETDIDKIGEAAVKVMLELIEEKGIELLKLKQSVLIRLSLSLHRRLEERLAPLF